MMPAVDGPVVLDVMGGDAAPGAALEAAALLSAEDIDVVLCGPADVVRGHGVPVMLAGTAVAKDEAPAFGVRSHPDIPVRVAARAVATGRARAMVSAGSTGATIAAAVLELGRRPGARRAVLAARIPTPARRVLLVDAGGMPHADPRTLLASARLGIAHARDTGTASPTVGLLNIGAEGGKGPRRLQHAAALLGGLEGYSGNIEPAAMLDGAVDVVVTDGFTGNIVLKTMEAMGRGTAGGGGGQRRADTAALVLGVRGTVLVAHGAATAIELADAVTMAGAMSRDTPDGVSTGTTGNVQAGHRQGTGT